MSLLQRGRDTVIVYPEESFADADGNLRVRASQTGVTVKAAVQVIGGIDGKERQSIGDLTEDTLRVRIAGTTTAYGAGTQFEVCGKRYSQLGEAKIYNGSPRTRHTEYIVRRA